jgi:hypothetical protein
VLADTYVNTNKKNRKMKTLKLLAIGIILLVSSSIQAQVSVNLNIGTAPSWVLWMHSRILLFARCSSLL